MRSWLREGFRSSRGVWAEQTTGNKMANASQARVRIMGASYEIFGSESLRRPATNNAPTHHMPGQSRKSPEISSSRGVAGPSRRQHLSYPSCAENPAVQGGDVERGERSSPCAKIFL